MTESNQGDDMLQARVRRIDRCLGEIHMDPARTDGVLAKIDEQTGYLKADARLTRTGVFTYADGEGNTWGELRTEDEVFSDESMRSFDPSHLTDDHPKEFVNASNCKELTKGNVGRITRDGNFLRAYLVVTDKGLIDKISAGKTRLSCGYTATVIDEPGVTDDGISFQARQTNIKGNHVAIVQTGRAGPDCGLLLSKGDAITHIEERTPMETRKIQIGDKEYEVPVEVADAHDAEAKKQKDQFPPPDDEDEEEDKDKDDSADMSKMQAKLDAMQAKLDAGEAARGQEPARVDARLELIADAREVLGKDAKTRGVTDSDLKKQIAAHVLPGIKDKLDGKSDDYLSAMYDQAMERHRADAEYTDEVSQTLQHTLVPKMDKDYADLKATMNAWNNGKAVG